MPQMDNAREQDRSRHRERRDASSSLGSIAHSKQRERNPSEGYRTSRGERRRRRPQGDEEEGRHDDGRSRHDDRRGDRSPHGRDVGAVLRRQRYQHRDGCSRSRSRSPFRRSSRSSPPAKRRRRPSYSESLSPQPRSRAALPSQDESFRGDVGRSTPGNGPPEKQKPNYKPTGLLAKEANTVQGTTTVLKYHEPPEAKKPPAKEQWRMYVFKQQDLLDTIHLYTKSVWLLGRDEKVTDLRLEHPSISKQHAVIQFRQITTTDQYGDTSSKVKPYLIDLDSANGTRLNGKSVETSKFVQLLHQDVVKFGDSDREYVMMLPTEAV